MMSCTVPAAWSHPVLSLYCTEHGPSCGAILSGHITLSPCPGVVSWADAALVGTHCSGLHICRCFSNAGACIENTRA
jgi:hypothetical protein